MSLKAIVGQSEFLAHLGVVGPLGEAYLVRTDLLDDQVG